LPTLNRNLLFGGPLLVALLVVVGPIGTSEWGVYRRLLFWSLASVASLGCVLMAARWLARSVAPRAGLWPRLLLSVALGGALYAPVSLALERAFKPPAASEIDDWGDRFAQRGIGAAILIEYTEFMPTLTLCWLMLNLPVIAAGGEPRGRADRLAGRARAATTADGAERRSPPVSPQAGEADDAPGDGADDGNEEFFAALPAAIGDDVISVSADLHYLVVHTADGKATIWFALRDAVRALGDRGLQVHRSHWVARRHVRRVRRGGGEWQIELSDGRRVPVSRRRRPAVRAELGTDFTAG
jgi:hypothetical protein